MVLWRCSDAFKILGVEEGMRPEGVPQYSSTNEQTRIRNATRVPLRRRTARAGERGDEGGGAAPAHLRRGDAALPQRPRLNN